MEALFSSPPRRKICDLDATLKELWERLPRLTNSELKWPLPEDQQQETGAILGQSYETLEQPPFREEFPRLFRRLP